MNALMLALTIAMDAGTPMDAGPAVVVPAVVPVVVFAGPAVVLGPTDAGAVKTDAGATKVDLVKVLKAVEAAPPVTDAEAPGMVDKLFVALKNHEFMSAAVAFSLLALWAAKKFRQAPIKGASVGTVTSAPVETPVPPSNPETEKK